MINTMETLIKRDSGNLPIIENLEIPLKDGFVDWRSLIKPEHLYINADWFQKRNLAVPSSVEGLEDHQLSIKLSGIKELARLRGFSSVRKSVSHVSPEHVVAGCSIEWIGNAETSMLDVEYEEFASATTSNTDSFGKNFLETIACNRAFIRCVRNFLNIHIVGFDEFVQKSSSHPEQTPSNFLAVTPQNTLMKLLETKQVFSMEDFKKKYLRPFYKNGLFKNDEAANWSDFSQIPPKDCLKLLSLLKKEV